jgi:hypothetical protein
MLTENVWRHFGQFSKTHRVTVMLTCNFLTRSAIFSSVHRIHFPLIMSVSGFGGFIENNPSSSSFSG